MLVIYGAGTLWKSKPLGKKTVNQCSIVDTLPAGLTQGRPWTQAESVGLFPDPTVVATLGLLLGWRPTAAPWAGRLLWLLPLGWCVGSAATLSSLGQAEAGLMGGVVVFTLICARLRREDGEDAVGPDAPPPVTEPDRAPGRHEGVPLHDDEVVPDPLVLPERERHGADPIRTRAQAQKRSMARP